MNKRRLITELQSQGLKLVDSETGASGRKGGAGPSDHKAITVDGTTVMVPIYNTTAARSPYTIRDQASTELTLEWYGEAISSISWDCKLVCVKGSEV